MFSFWPSCERDCSRNGFELLVTAKVSLQFPKLDRLTQGNSQRTFCGNHRDKVGWLTKTLLNFEKCKIGLKAVNQMLIFRTSCWTTFMQRTLGFRSLPVSVIYCISKPRSVHNSQSQPHSSFFHFNSWRLHLLYKKENFIAHFWAANCLHFLKMVIINKGKVARVF